MGAVRSLDTRVPNLAARQRSHLQGDHARRRVDLPARPVPARPVPARFWKFGFLTLVVGILYSASPAQARSIRSKVLHVADGDTITVLAKGIGRTRVRLRAIDAPEISQPYGRVAQETLASKINGKDVRIEYSHRDRYGRILGDVYLQDRLINREMLGEGLAWHYRQFHKSQVFDDLMDAARENQDGLWKSKFPVRPDIWRRRHPKDYSQSSPQKLIE